MPVVAVDNRRILLVGLDEAWRLLTAYLFEDAGYAVYAAADPRQAVAFTTRLLPDVVVVQMETPDTLDILARLSEGSSTYDIPVVVLTTSSAEEDILRSYKLHANAYVTKPVDLDQFMRAVRQIDEFFVQVVRLPQS